MGWIGWGEVGWSGVDRVGWGGVDNGGGGGGRCACVREREMKDAG